MAIEHSAKWIDKWQERIREPINNTKRYYYKGSIIQICTVVLAYWGIKHLLKLRKYLNSYINLATDCLVKGRAITNDGAPGAGKTVTGANMAYFLAQRRWAEMKSEYYSQKSMLAEWCKRGDTDKLYGFRTLEESYFFYAERESTNIPCLISSVPLKEYGTNRWSYVLEPEVYAQIERVPEYCVLFNDESGRLFGGDTSKSATDDIKDFWRYIRHFLDAMAVNTNQDGDQNAIYMRRSTDFVNHINGQEWIMPPVRLLRRIERKEARFFKKMERGKLSEKQSIYIGQKLYFLKKYAATIGFRRVSHRLCTQSGEFVGDEEEYILPAIGCVEYDDRAYRNLYKCKDKPLCLKGWNSLVVEGYDRDKYDSIINKAGN